MNPENTNKLYVDEIVSKDTTWYTDFQSRWFVHFLGGCLIPRYPLYVVYMISCTFWKFVNVCQFLTLITLIRRDISVIFVRYTILNIRLGRNVKCKCGDCVRLKNLVKLFTKNQKERKYLRQRKHWNNARREVPQNRFSRLLWCRWIIQWRN